MPKEHFDSHYTSSIHYDYRLYMKDIEGSIAHARMLAKQGIITQKEFDEIQEGLKEILSEMENSSFPWKQELEDIHMNIESRLFEKIGNTAGKLHTGRSRNDQVATDMRMYTKDAISETINKIRSLQESLLNKAEQYIEVILPGYTHLQRAQPVLFSHHLLAYFYMFERDVERMGNCFVRTDVMPLGSGALAGVPYPIDRDFTASQLGFNSISDNSMDAVSDRDFLLDYHSSASICMMHLSRMAEEIVLWSSQEFDFIEIASNYTTGSSIMPQKRNPDFAELARGKTGRVYGNLVGLLTVLKGLPLTYNRDLQEDKESFFDTFDTIRNTLDVFSGMIETMKINTDKTQCAAEDSNLLATDLADYLVSKGETFRKAHGIVSELINIASSRKIPLGEIDFGEYKNLSPHLEGIMKHITAESSVTNRDVPGGTNPTRVRKSLDEARSILRSNIG